MTLDSQAAFFKSRDWMEEKGIPAGSEAVEDRAARDLTAAIAAGDSEALGRFYRSWFDRAYLLVRSLTRRDEAFCLDVVQDSFLRVVRSLKPMASAGSLDRWMARVVHTTALDHIRREARRSRHEAQAGATKKISTDADTAERGVLLAEQVRWLEARLAELDDEERTLLIERFAEGKTLAAAGKAAGVSGNAAHGRLRRLLARLRVLAREVLGG